MLEKIERFAMDEKGEQVKIIDIREKIPKELRWVTQIKMLENKGYIVKYVYGNTECDVPRGELDSEGKSLIPSLPDKFIVYKYELGRGLVKVTEFEGRSNIDPTPEMAMNIWGLFGI